MSSIPQDFRAEPRAVALADAYKSVREQSLALCATLEPEDTVVQSMADVSPTKWHLAHTTWFFEHFVLRTNLPGYVEFHEKFNFLVNSYYYTVGKMHLRPERGLLSRPTLAEVKAFREHVDEHMATLLEREARDAEIATLVTLGLHHEQQHQELILTDIKHVFSCNPLSPALIESHLPDGGRAPQMRFINGPEGIQWAGFGRDRHGRQFCFDNETPRHEQLLRPHALASRPITNGEFREFIDAGGYTTPELWLSDGWATVNREGWRHPLYWSDDLQAQFTLAGMSEINPEAPVTHVSFFEAEAFARWAGARLPTEFELELALEQAEIKGNFVESGALHPRIARGGDDDGFRQLYGDVWEWTCSPYSPYPGFTPLDGSLGEYNGKFMCNQMVLRGGSCATPASHIRPTYRNFFYPDARWQFSGIRLATDL